MDDEAAVADEDKMRNEGQRPFGGRAAAQGAELTAEQKEWMEVDPRAAACPAGTGAHARRGGAAGRNAAARPRAAAGPR
jgi:hypothetical protein